VSGPIHRAVQVRCDASAAFRAFTERIELWWPPNHRRLAGAQLVLEGEVGGRFLERGPGGAEALWGAVQVWEPPHRLVLTWWPGALTAPTLVEVRFTPIGPETRVEITHSEADAQLGAEWPGRAARFEANWIQVLTALANHVTPPEAPEPAG